MPVAHEVGQRGVGCCSACWLRLHACSGGHPPSQIGGTARDYWKTYVDVQGDYTDKVCGAGALGQSSLSRCRCDSHAHTPMRPSPAPQGWVDKSEPSGTASSVPGLPFLVATALGLVAAAVVVAERT